MVDMPQKVGMLILFTLHKEAHNEIAKEMTTMFEAITLTPSTDLLQPGTSFGPDASAIKAHRKEPNMQLSWRSSDLYC